IYKWSAHSKVCVLPTSAHKSWSIPRPIFLGVGSNLQKGFFQRGSMTGKFEYWRACSVSNLSNFVCFCTVNLQAAIQFFDAEFVLKGVFKHAEFRAANEYAGAFGSINKALYRTASYQLALAYDDQIVSHLRHFAEQMAAHKDSIALIGIVFKKTAQPVDSLWIKTVSRFIRSEERRVGKEW